MRVTVLGSGDAYGSGGRGHSAYLLEAPGCTFLLDCGPSVLQSLKRAGHDSAAIDFVLLSHLHGDHFGGIPFLFMEYRYENPRTRPFAVFGPPDTERRVRGLFSALYEQTAREALPFGLRYQEVVPGSPVVMNGVRVLPFAVSHVAELVCLGYRIEAAGRTIVYSGDASWSDEFLTRLPIHISYPEIASRARDLGCRRLVLTHLGSEPLRHLEELSLECARDGMILDL